MATRTNGRPPPAKQADAPLAAAPAAGGRTGEREKPLHEQVESQTAIAFEQLVSKPSFGRLLAMTGENVAALARIGSDSADLVLRHVRLASRADTTRLARQLHRTEDKLERVLQEVEALRDQLASANPANHDSRRNGVKQP
jgi:hypothetical protein